MRSGGLVGCIKCGGSYHPFSHVRANHLFEAPPLQCGPASCNVPLTWPWPASSALPPECMDFLELYWPPRPWEWHVAWLNLCTPHILFYFIFPLYDLWFIDNDVLHSYLYILFHLISIVRKKEMWIYVLEKNIPIRGESHTSI